LLLNATDSIDRQRPPVAIHSIASSSASASELVSNGPRCVALSHINHYDLWQYRWIRLCNLGRRCCTKSVRQRPNVNSPVICLLHDRGIRSHTSRAMWRHTDLIWRRLPTTGLATHTEAQARLCTHD